jgi:hypothetical protein
MRGFSLGLFLSVAVLLPKTGNAQVYQFRTPPPEVNAAGAIWQINSQPVIVGGLVYYATRGFRMFDGQVMAQVGLFEGVPVYMDTTLEPFSVLYVPIGRENMREYERRRDRELAGTTGSRAPAFPVESPAAEALRERPVGTVGTSGMIEPATALYPVGTSGVIGVSGAAASPSAVGTAGVIDRRAIGAVGTGGIPDRARPRRTFMQSIPRPSTNNGVWLDFDGARWYSAGAATSFSPDRFEPVGMYRGFPVYRDKNNRGDEIWVSVVKDGPLAPYVKR